MDNPTARPLEGDPTVTLGEVSGTVWSVRAFTKAHLHLLSGFERRFMDGRETLLPRDEDIPSGTGRCLAMVDDQGNQGALRAVRCGARSAWNRENRLKWKGCHLGHPSRSFPIERLSFGQTSIRYGRIPFGTLRAGAVLREILAFVFLASHHLPVISEPICVYGYERKEKLAGCCLVMRTAAETRIEDFIEYPQATVADAILADSPRGWMRMKEKGLYGSELPLRGINLAWYAEEKARWLAAMHFHGGFRGVLNSNIGNDVVWFREGAPPELLLCDFDTFFLQEIPQRPNQRFLEAFSHQAVIETVKGSLPIYEYLTIPAGAGPGERAALLAGVYGSKSSLWRAYRRRFTEMATQAGWASPRVEQALLKAMRTPAFAAAAAGCVLNSHHLSEMLPRRSTFFLHNSHNVV